MFRALRDIHARGIIHRDLKPANFLFNPTTWEGTMVDFGLAEVWRDVGRFSSYSLTSLDRHSNMTTVERLRVNILHRQSSTHMDS